MVKQWGNIGIEAENRFLELYYQPESKQFLAHFYKGLGDGYGVKSLYARHLSDDSYRKITPESEDLTYEDILLCPELSKIFVNVFIVDRDGGKCRGYNWHSVQIMDTDTGEVSEVLNQSDLSFAEPYVSASVTELRAVKQDGRELVCTIAFKRKANGSGPKVDNYICKVSVTDRSIKKVTKLRG